MRHNWILHSQMGWDKQTTSQSEASPLPQESGHLSHKVEHGSTPWLKAIFSLNLFFLMRQSTILRQTRRPNIHALQKNSLCSQFCNTHTYLWHKNAEFDTIGSYLVPKCTQYNHWFTELNIPSQWFLFQIEKPHGPIPSIVRWLNPHGPIWPHGPGQQPDLSSGCGCDFCSGSWIYI